jgi:alanyl-tRNA synthetase
MCVATVFPNCFLLGVDEVMKTLMMAALLAVVAIPAFAADEEPAQRGQGRLPALRFLNGIELTKEQKQQLREIRTELAPQLQEVTTKMQELVPAEKRQAAAQAVAKAKADGKMGKELKEIREAALGLNEAQLAQMAELTAKQKELSEKLKEKVMGILTDAQKEQIKAAAPPQRGNRQPAST